jgi:hypothetical protein
MVCRNIAKSIIRNSTFINTVNVNMLNVISSFVLYGKKLGTTIINGYIARRR